MIPRRVIEKRKAIVDALLAYTPDDREFNKGVRAALRGERAALDEILNEKEKIYHLTEMETFVYGILCFLFGIAVSLGILLIFR